MDLTPAKKRIFAAFALLFLTAAAFTPFLGASGQAAMATITITSPMAGDSWAAGSQHTITWTSDGVSGWVEIKLRRGSSMGNEEMDIANSIANSGWYNWTVPSGLASASDYYIGVEAKSMEGVKGYSQAFSINGVASGGLMVLSASSDEAWEENSTHSISISGCTPGEMYEVKLMKNGVVVDNLTSFRATKDTESVEWKVDASSGDNYRLMVMSADGNHSALSSSTFHVSTQSVTSDASNGAIIMVVAIVAIAVIIVAAYMLLRKKK
jgi:hypothetical protein